MNRRAMPSGLPSAILAPFGSLYSGVMRARAAAYRSGLFASAIIEGAIVISIGNLTTGGTGKTPLVRCVARIAHDELARMEPARADDVSRICILSRGYGRTTRGRVLVSDGETIFADAGEGGDEPRELAGALRGVAAVIADADRVSAARWAMEHLRSRVFVLDDGFQHLRLRRDLDIVTIDATDPFGGGRVLPAGALREPLAALRRADLIVLTRTEQAPPGAELITQIADLSGAPVLRAHTRAHGFHSLHVDGDTRSDARLLDARSAFAFCALGNPSAFFETLSKSGLRVAGKLAFPDHHRYTAEDIERITTTTRICDAELIVTTMKDAVKLGAARWELPCYALNIEIEIDDEAMLRRLVRRSIEDGRGRP